MTLIDFVFDTVANIITWIGGNPWRLLYILIAFIVIAIVVKRIVD